MATNQRRSKRQPISAEGMIYDSHGKQLLACTVRNVSNTGAYLELSSEADLPETFVIALSRDGHVRRRCQKIWQLSAAAGARFVGLES